MNLVLDNNERWGGFMHVRSVKFSTAPENEEQLRQKMADNLAGLKTWESCLNVEVWRAVGRGSVSYQLVSKWADKKDFQAWIGRPEHLEEHRKKAQEKRPSLFEKEMATFETVEF